ncbi:MAG: hypothetical protein II569_05110, partial [Paludibacteraceae bacterium]|nr:hypothetical protein [Paludibacteraceae bacterium]
MKKNIFKTLAVTVLSAVSLTAWAVDPVSYVYYTVDGTTATMHNDGSQTSYTVVTDQTEWSDGWYVVNSNVTIADRITVSGTVNLILCDNATLTASKGITVTGENTLNIYAQSVGSGELIASALEAQGTGWAGIGGKSETACGTVIIHGGKVTATGDNSNGGAGIGGGDHGAGGTVTIYAGTVNATGNYGGAGIGGSKLDVGGSVTIYGGTVTATGGTFMTYTGMGIGAGSMKDDNGSLTLGTGVTMEVSSDNSTWTEYDGSTRAQYMKTAVTVIEFLLTLDAVSNGTLAIV